MNDIKKYMVINSLMCGKSLDDIIGIVGEPIEDIALGVFGIESDYLYSLFERLDSAKRDIEESSVVRLFIGFMQLHEYSISTNEENSAIISTRVLRDMILSGKLKDTNIILNILMSMFTGFVGDTRTCIIDGVIHADASEYDNLSESLLKACAYFVQADGIITPQQVMQLRDTCSIQNGLKIIAPAKLGKIVMKCLRSGYHPCILTKTCVDIPNMFEMYKNTGMLAQRSIKDPSKVIYVAYNPSTDSCELNRCSQDTFVDVVRETLTYA